jgi:hypothetical protein
MSSSSEEAASSVLKSLCTLLQSTRATATKQHVLAACLGLASARPHRHEGADWDLVFRTAFNMMSMNQAGAAGHQLFRLLYPEQRRRSLLPLEQAYGLFTHQLVKVTPDALGTLNALLLRFPLQKHAAAATMLKGH